MDLIDHIQNCKKLLIEEILKTNNNIQFFTIYDNLNFLSNLVNKFEKENFYKLLALLNHINYNGYFSQSKRLQLVQLINQNKKENIKEFLKEWLEEEVPNKEVMNIEIFSLNILLEKMIFRGKKSNLLEELEEIKFSLFTSTNNLRNKFYNFKTQIVCRDKIERDVYNTLKSIINGNHNLAIKDLVYIKNIYQDEIEILTNKIRNKSV